MLLKIATNIRTWKRHINKRWESASLIWWFYWRQTWGLLACIMTWRRSWYCTCFSWWWWRNWTEFSKWLIWWFNTPTSLIAKICCSKDIILCFFLRGSTFRNKWHHRIKVHNFGKYTDRHNHNPSWLGLQYIVMKENLSVPWLDKREFVLHVLLLMVLMKDLG